MAIFQPRVFPEIMSDMIAKVISVTPLTDVNFASVFTSMLEAAATEDDEQYFQMLEIIRAFSLDTTSGEDLDLRAQESVGDRLVAEKATSFVQISDSAITKVVTNTYSGNPGAIQDALTIDADSATGFSASGSIVIGRNTQSNVETVSYSSITQFTNFARFNLTSGLVFDHGTDETIIFSQAGSRLIPSGTVVYVPESDISERIEYLTTAVATVLDGESEVDGVPVEASTAGAAANVPIGSIQRFDSKPFPTATVRNTAKITNGRDIETDQELRDRIKDHIQSLSRGTGKSIITGISGLVSTDDNKRVVSSSLIEPTVPADVVKLFIDDGADTLFNNEHVGVEVVVTSATGGEKFLSTVNTPIIKAFVQTVAVEPYNMSGGEELFVDVGGEVETIFFDSTDFELPGEVTAQEIVAAINADANSFEARVGASEGNQVKIFARSNINEEIRVTGGSANTSLLFPTDEKFTTKLYRTRDNAIKLLSKDGRTASIESGNFQGYNLDLAMARDLIHLSLVVDSKDSVQHLKIRPNTDFDNPVVGTVEEVIVLGNQQISGVVFQESSNGNKFRIVSNTERSLSSAVKILENFTDILSEESAVLVDRTNDIQDSGTNTVIFADDLDLVYFGHDVVKFASIFVKMNTLASGNVNPAFEYWDGSFWVEMGVNDMTVGFTQDGNIFFEPPYDWEITTVNGIAAYFIRVQRNQAIAITPPEVTRMRVCGANEEFGFSEAEVVGQDRDYTFNRFIGQIELEEPLQEFDKIELGSYNTRAFAVSVAAGNYGGLVGQALDIYVDGVLQSYTFVAGDFFTPASALPTEVVDAINANFTSLVATTDGLYVTIIINRYNGGTLQIPATGANTIFQFPSELRVSLISHVAAVESTSAGPFVFNPEEKLIVVIDDNLANAQQVPMFHFSGLTSNVSLSIVADSNLNVIFPLDVDLVGYDLYIFDGPQAGERRSVVAYTAATGQLQVDTPFLGLPGLAAYYIFPTTSQQIVDLVSRTKISLLTITADITVTNNGFLQIASKIASELSSVQVPGGLANVELQFPTIEQEGVDGYRYLIGLPQKVQWTVDGREEDPVEYPGIRAAGVQIEVTQPVRKPISIQLDVTPTEGTTLSSITTPIRSAVSGVINSLGVGEDVILSEIICEVRDLPGIFDVQVELPLENVAVADNELAKIREKDISIG